MPDVQEVFRVATQNVRPDPGALERQLGQQRRRTTRRKAGAYALAAALFAAIVVIAVRAGINSREQVPLDQPSSPTTAPPAEPVGTVTSDGSTCSIEMTAPQIEAGFVVFEAVNDTDERAMFDSWLLSEGYSFRAFERAVQRDVQLAEEGKGAFPGADKVTYLRSDVIPAHSSETIAVPMSAGRHAITCLKPFEGQGLRPFGIAGPITVP
jgi:hypothetical protein